jgi:hypothetical protein
MQVFVAAPILMWFSRKKGRKIVSDEIIGAIFVEPPEVCVA